MDYLTMEECKGGYSNISVMTDHFTKYAVVGTCGRCLRRKGVPTPQVTAPLVNIKTTRPMKLVCMDYLTMEECKGGYSNVLVITNHFTKFAVAVPTKAPVVNVKTTRPTRPMELVCMDYLTVEECKGGYSNI